MQNTQPLLDALPLALLALDKQWTIEYSNAAAENLLNTSSASMQGKRLHDILKLDEEWQALIAKSLQFHQGVKGYSLPLIHIKGSVLGKTHAHISKTLDGQLLLVLEPAMVGERLEHHATRQTSMQSAAVMSDILAHEIRNPLSGIKGAAQLLKSRAAQNTDATMLDLICKEVERISKLVDSVEYFGSNKPITLEPINIHEILRHVCTLAEQGFASEITLNEHYDPSLPLILGNRDLLVQALLNLMKNAAESAIAFADEPQLHIKTSYKAGYKIGTTLPVCVEIIDNGSGIAEHLRDSIFNPFVTSKPQGKGLGLAIVGKIITDHGGVIALEDASAGHTCFALHLKAA